MPMGALNLLPFLRSTKEVLHSNMAKEGWSPGASQFPCAHESPGNLINAQILIQWVWVGGLRLCISDKLPSDARALVQGPHLGW